CGSAQTGPDRDHTVKVNASDLRPASAYYYRFICRGQVSPVGRTRTAPEHDADVANLRFGVVSCSHLAAGYFAAYRFLSERDDLFAVIHLGDYIYEGPPFAGEGRGGHADHAMRTAEPGAAS
ncbi:PhoD-like phosphatase N-terminal domain-containing protein, partial [Kibdelosporangium lantanae]